jgi:hypothetical protein
LPNDKLYCDDFSQFLDVIFMTIRFTPPWQKFNQTLKNTVCILIAALTLLCASVSAGVIAINYIPSASNTELQGFIRITNGSSAPATVSLFPIDDAGNIKPIVNIALNGYETKTFNSIDLENGNASKGLPLGIGQGIGNWRMFFISDSSISVMGLVRSPSTGFLNSVHDLTPAYISRTLHELAMFNPARNPNQQSKVRLSNNTELPNTFIINGIDDSGKDAGNVSIIVPPFATTTLSSTDIEQGNSNIGLKGALGAGSGKWRLIITSTGNASVMGLMELPGGYISNISSLANQPASDEQSNVLSCSDINGASLFSQESKPVYLGFFGNSVATDSINTSFGNYGSTYSSTSVRTTYSNYGSPYGSYSAMSATALSPPVIVKKGKAIAFLTANVSLTGLPALSLASIDACSFSSTSPSGPFVQ